MWDVEHAPNSTGRAVDALALASKSAVMFWDRAHFAPVPALPAGASEALAGAVTPCFSSSNHFRARGTCRYRRRFVLSSLVVRAQSSIEHMGFNDVRRGH
jgi:hypothetical protein